MPLWQQSTHPSSPPLVYHETISAVLRLVVDHRCRQHLQLRSPCQRSAAVAASRWIRTKRCFAAVASKTHSCFHSWWFFLCSQIIPTTERLNAVWTIYLLSDFSLCFNSLPLPSNVFEQTNVMLGLAQCPMRKVPFTQCTLINATEATNSNLYIPD